VGRMPGGDLRKGYTGGSRGDQENWGNDIASFVVWKDGPEGCKGRIVVNLFKQSKHWPKGSARMETLAEFALELEHGDRMVSFDIKAGYLHFRLAPQI
jgi:hypothetical protein